MKTNILIPEILDLLQMVDTNEEKAEILRSYKTPALMEVLRIVYDPRVVFDTEVPRYNPDASPLGLAHNSLYQEMRRMYLFLPETKHITPKKKSSLLAEILESVHVTEAFLIEAMFRKDLSHYDINEDVVRMAFPNLLPAKEATV